MKIKDGLSLPGWCVEIPDCGRDDLPEFFMEMGYHKGAEIGVWQGEFTEVLCQSGSKVYAVDPWMHYADCDYYGRRRPANLEDSYQIAKKRLTPLGVTIIRKTSMDALDEFRDNSLDWVYIDGNHSFAYVANDVYHWTKKVRKGGVISGHDYINIISRRDPMMCTVKYMLDAYTRAARINKWYVLGEKYPKPGQTREKLRSWFWIKDRY